jgi:branched-chain amino acid transport system ATP-binding protein
VLAPDRGEIRYRGQDITGLSPDRRARLGMCRSFQILNLFNDNPGKRPRCRPCGNAASTSDPRRRLREAEDQAAAVIRLIGLAGRT